MTDTGPEPCAMTTSAPASETSHRRALVLMGGGARTAYQVGVLGVLGSLLTEDQQEEFPFQIVVGTSAGALNAAFLASQAGAGIEAFPQLAGFWGELRSSDVYRLDVPHWLPNNLLLAGLTLTRQVKRHHALLDSMPLVDCLHRSLHLPAIETAMHNSPLEALAVTASSYTSGDHWTFCQTGPNHPVRNWHRPGRRSSLEPISIEHLLASSAIPFLFPAVPLWVDGHKEFFGDGSMRQLSPLSPAIQLGADKVMVIGVGQPQRASLTGHGRRSDQDPTAGTIAGHALASVFHDTLLADVEQAERMNDTLARLPAQAAALLPYRPVDVLVIQPSRSLDELALAHVHTLPASTRDTLEGLGVLDTRRGAAGSAAALASYLLFEPAFVNALIEWGEADARAHAAELRAFFQIGKS
ncbi:MAG TPA: patatin-like phospholipase family protein [Macromonas sp.]|nr:patatin-like phospholipase family protein [Macromonas sp.]